MRHLYLGDRIFRQTNKSLKSPIYYNRDNNVALVMSCANFHWRLNDLCNMMPDELATQFMNTLMNDENVVVRVVNNRTNKWYVSVYRGIEIEDENILRSIDSMIDFIIEEYGEHEFSYARYKEIVNKFAINLYMG